MAGTGNTSKKNTSSQRSTGSTQRKTTTKGKSTAKRTSNSSTKRQASKQPVRDEKELAVIKGLLTILTFAVCIFVFLCCTDLFSTKATDLIKQFMVGLFGVNAYVLPFALPGIYIFSQKGKNVSLYLLKLISLICLLFVIGMGAHIIEYKDLVDYKELSYLSQFFENQKGGGVIFGCLSLWLEMLISKPGAFLVVILLAVLSLYILFGNFVFKVIRESSERYNQETEDEEKYENIEKNGKIGFSIFKKYGENEEADSENVPKARVTKKPQSGVTFDTDLKKSTGPVAPVSSVNPVIEPFVTQSIDPVQAPLVKESNDIHQVHVDYDDVPAGNLADEDDWVIKPASKKEETIVSQTVMPVTPVAPPANEPIKAASDTKPLEEVTENVKPVAHLRSRDKADMPSGVLTGDLASSKKSPAKEVKYQFPPLSLLSDVSSGKEDSKESLDETARQLENVLASFGVNVKVIDKSQGPAVTRYELQPEVGVKVNKILSLADDIKLNLAAADIRIEAPIPGKSAVGIEVPNKSSSAVSFKDLVSSKEFKTFDSNLAFAVGKDIAGANIVTDISKMPHLLIAGATGSGKSVCINTLIMSILYKAHPDDVKLIMVDPKVVELSVYNGIPHLLNPVVTDPKMASSALKWGVSEMDKRYKLFADAGVRDLKGFNEAAAAGKCSEDGTPFTKLYQLVIIVDELADLMMVAGKEVEESICRLAQLARAAGIHLIIATQRPSVDVITGLIKANMPSRIAFSVSSGIDSRTILDTNGAEKLLGRGDMLFFPQGFTKPSRVQGCFVPDSDVVKVVEFISSQGYVSSTDNTNVNSGSSESTSVNFETPASAVSDNYDELFEKCARVIIEKEKASIGYLQRLFRIGFNRAARIMDQLEDAGVVGPEEGTKPRVILMTMEQFDEYLQGKQ